jgi:hypothetical protein
MDRYGVAADAVKLVIPSSWRLLEELYTLWLRLEDLRRDSVMSDFCQARCEELENIR